MTNDQGKHQVLKIRHLTESTFVLRLKRHKIEFTPGQCVNLGLPNEAVNREYSTYSGIKEKHLEFLIKAVKDGLVSPAIQKLKPGDYVTIDGSYGLFVIHQPNNHKLKYTFIGTGTGIAPFHSYVKSYPHLDYQIIHGIRTKNEKYDYQDYDPKRYQACLSQEKGNNKDFSGRITSYLKKQKIDKQRIYYLCGNADMINDVYDILSDAGVNGNNIFTEVFF